MDPSIMEATRLWTLAVPRVSAFITSLVRDFQDRDDVLQETAVAVLQGFSRYDSTQPFVAWAIGIARNQALLHLRRKCRDKLAFDSDAINVLATAFADEAANEHQLEALHGCLQSLDARSRQLCQLRYADDLKPAAIGERLGLAANAVAKALQRIRDRLRECLQRKAVTG